MSEQETRGGLEELTVEQLNDVARDLNVEGRSTMKKAELIEAIEQARIELREEAAQPPDAVQPRKSVTGDTVPVEQYLELERENHQLRVRLQEMTQGAVGAPQMNAPSPGQFNP